MDSSFIERLVVDLTVKGLSLNQIREHIRLIYSLDVKKNEVRKIQRKAAQNAKNVNHKFDRKVSPKIRVLEADEAFQGKKTLSSGQRTRRQPTCLGSSPPLTALRPASPRSSAPSRGYAPTSK
ncbi:MAG TPA: hypothetical protein VKK79_17750 [Candidatus Lokiarchaeia archaeon]|nr:hypothetical protein [Candidatus Lokiarchaeia archaeon]